GRACWPEECQRADYHGQGERRCRNEDGEGRTTPNLEGNRLGESQSVGYGQASTHEAGVEKEAAWDTDGVASPRRQGRRYIHTINPTAPTSRNLQRQPDADELRMSL